MLRLAITLAEHTAGADLAAGRMAACMKLPTRTRWYLRNGDRELIWVIVTGHFGNQVDHQIMASAQNATTWLTTTNSIAIPRIGPTCVN